MKIAQVAPLYEAVPPRLYGGTERIVAHLTDALVERGMMAWAALFGTVSFELFGQLHHVVGDEPSDRDAYFAECVRRWTTQVGINPEQTQRMAREPEQALEAVNE